MRATESTGVAEVVADLTARLATAQRALVARDKTIQALVTRERDRAAKRSSIFGSMEDSAALQRVVVSKTMELEAKNRELRQSEKRFRSLFENVGDALFLHGPDGKLEDVNQMACESLGYTRAELLQLSHSDIELGVQPDRRQILFSRIFQGESLTVLGVHKRKDGTTFPVEVRLSLFRLGGGQSVFAAARDITERKRAEAELARLHQELIKSSRAAGMAEVATNVLHNVGNVLNSVNVSATMVADQVRRTKAGGVAKLAALLDEHQTDLADFLTVNTRGQTIPRFLGALAESLATEQATIVRELDHLRTNIEHIKDIVAMQQGYASAAGVIETVAVQDLLEDVLRINAASFARHEVEIVRDFRCRPVVEIDRHKVMQILVNLLRNAKDACDESCRSDKRIVVCMTGDERVVRIAVADNGVGIAPENLTRIFNHGFTTKKTGHGFGLHSAALAAKELRGSLTVASDGPGCGATFTLELPIPPVEAPDA